MTNIKQKIKREYERRRYGMDFLSPVRKITQVKTEDRIVAMTFDDGPSTWGPCGGLSSMLLDALAEHNAKGTFNVIGTTSVLYPDKRGDIGSRYWSGYRYDHYPLYGYDSHAGVYNCDAIVKRTVREGHELANHTECHILFGRSPLYGKREHLDNIDEVQHNLTALHNYIQHHYGYKMKLARPPHYVNDIPDGFNSYDAFALCGYDYLAASFDGGGWKGINNYDDAVSEMVIPFAAALQSDPNFMCGKIIANKNTCNMSLLTPVVTGLKEQLKLLKKEGYKVVTASELLKQAPFEDAGAGDYGFQEAKYLLECGLCPAFRDNTLRLDRRMTLGELCMLVYGKKSVMCRIARMRNDRADYFNDLPARHPYGAACMTAVVHGAADGSSKKFGVNRLITPDDVARISEVAFGVAAFTTAEHPTARDVIYAFSKIVRPME